MDAATMHPEPTAAKDVTENRFYSRYLWLIYSAFFFVEPVMEHSARKWIGIAIFYPVFLCLYLYPDDHRKHNNLCAFLLFIASLIYLPFNGTSAGSIIYVGAFLPWLVEESRRFFQALAVVVGLYCLDGYVFHVSRWAWIPCAIFALVVALANWGHSKEKRANAQLKRAQEEVTHLAKVAERERIARDLHDLLGHTLSMITLKAELAGKFVTSDPERARQEIRDVEQTARRALTEVRQAVRGYRSEGLLAEMERAAHTLDTAGVTLTRPDKLPADLSPAEETVVAMIVREAVTNIVRHARATRAEFQLAEEHGRMLVDISDNGRGGIVNEGSGIRGMRERMEALGGRFLWESHARSGTRLHCQFALANASQSERLRAQLAPEEALASADVNAAAVLGSGAAL